MNATAQKGAGHPRSPALSAEVVLQDWRVWEAQATRQMAAWHPGQGQPQVDGNFQKRLGSVCWAWQPGVCQWAVPTQKAEVRPVTESG